LRFIEFMDVGSTNGWRMDDVIPSAEVVRRISEAFPLEPAEANYAGEVAQRGAATARARSASLPQSRRPSARAATACACLPRACSTPACSRPGPRFEGCCAAASARHAIRDSIAAVWRARRPLLEIRTAETAKSRKVEMSYIGG
jgi:cyclic pyranopterin phosphate synthase